MIRSSGVWTRVRFGDVVRLSTERCTDPLAHGIDRYVGLEHLEPGNLRIRSWGYVADGVTFTSRFRPGQVLFGKRRAYQRKAAVAEFDGICSSDIYVFEPANDQLLPGLLPFICQTDGFFEHALKTSAGSLSPRTNWTSLANYEFDLPPLDAQKDIVALLEGRRQVAESLSYLQYAADSVRRSLIEDRLSALNASAPQVVIGTISDVAYGLTVDSRRRALTSTRPYLRVANVHRDRFDLTEVKEIGYSDADHACLLRDGDILVVEGHANADEIGRAAVWRDELPTCLHQNHLIRVRPHDGFDSSYVALALNSSIGRRHFRSAAKSTSGLNTINSTVVKNFSLPAPDLAAQRALVNEVIAISATATAISRRRAVLRSLMVPNV
jgi:type I restriction enzyme S subunit